MTGKIVLGLGGTVDFEVAWDADVLDALVFEYGITADELTTTAPILDERGLVVTVLGFVAAGAGGERFVASSDIVARFAARFDTAVTLGGTGVRAGLALDRLGIPSVQHLVSIDDNVRRLLPPSITYVSSATADTLDPHLIVQYPAGATVQLAKGATVTAPGANRIIFANDLPNREMALSADLPDALANAAVFLVSGFNTMTDPSLLARRLDELRTAMTRLADDALVYYEDAGFYDRSFPDRIRDRLLPRIDVYGMNEDEMQEYLHRPVDLLAPREVTAALRDMHRLIPARALVVHTRYWAIGVGPDASRHLAALDSAVRMAATRYRLGDACTASDFDATKALPRHRGGAQLIAVVERLLPDAVGVAAFELDTPSPTTIGLGDTFVGGFLAAYAPAPGAPS